MEQVHLNVGGAHEQKSFYDIMHVLWMVNGSETNDNGNQLKTDRQQHIIILH